METRNANGNNVKKNFFIGQRVLESTSGNYKLAIVSTPVALLRN
jgi:hypothetical protein